MKNVFDTANCDRYLNRMLLEKVEPFQDIKFSLIEHQKEG